MKSNVQPYTDLSAVFFDDVLMMDAEMFYGAHGKIFQNARELRKRETEAEKLLWLRLQKKQIGGFHFRRQHPIGEYVADFYCHQAKLVIEVDGSAHNDPKQRDRDEERSWYMTKQGITTLRFTNHQVETKINTVIQMIKTTLDSLCL